MGPPLWAMARLKSPLARGLRASRDTERDPADWQSTYRDLGQCPARREAFAAHFDLGSPHVDVTETSFPAFWRAIASPTQAAWDSWSAPTALVPQPAPQAGPGGNSSAATACPGGS